MLTPPQTIVLALLLLTVPASVAQDHAHGDHVAALGAVTVLHAWTTPAEAGENALVFLEIENDGEPIELNGAESELAGSVEIVGAAMMSDGTMGYQPVGPFTIPAGSFGFDPAGLGLLLNDLRAPIAEGEAFEMHLLVGDGELEISVEVQAAGAKAHSHAGHSH